MKYRIRELVGPLLDAAVAKADGYVPEQIRIIEAGAGEECQVRDEDTGWSPRWYSSLWEHGGPLLEEEIDVLRRVADGWVADGMALCNGPTILIAVARAYAVAKLGEEVELP